MLIYFGGLGILQSKISVANTELCSATPLLYVLVIYLHGNCFYNLIGSLKLDLHLTMMWSFFVFELARGRVFGWIPTDSLTGFTEIKFIAYESKGCQHKNIMLKFTVPHKIRSPNIFNTQVPRWPYDKSWRKE